MYVEPGLVKRIDKIVRELGLYSSRNDFVRDALRSKVFELSSLKSPLPSASLSPKNLSEAIEQTLKEKHKGVS